MVVKSFSAEGSIEWCELGMKSLCTPSLRFSVWGTQLPVEAWQTSHMFYYCVQILCWNLNRVRRVHIIFYQQSRCLEETNETKVLAIFSICSMAHSKNWNILHFCQVSKRENPSPVKKEREREVNMRIQRNQKQVETRYDLSTVDIHIAHTGLTYIQSD